jgi:hypothetical protein
MPVMPAVPGAAGQIADLPFARKACGRAECDYSADEFVTQPRDVRRAHASCEDSVVTVADSTGVDFKQDFAYAGLEHRNLFDLKRLVLAGDDGRLEGLWEVG